MGVGKFILAQYIKRFLKLRMDRVVTDLFMDADKHALEASKIPPNITQWKLSTKVSYYEFLQIRYSNI